MLQLTKLATATAFGLLLLTTIGCSKPGADPAVIAAHQTRLTLAEEPDGVQTVADVRAMLLGDHDNHDHDNDGHQDHDAADHDDHAHADHDEDGHDDHDAKDHDAEHHGDHDDHAHDDHKDHDHDDDGHPDHDAKDHDDHAGHDDHSDHDHAEHAHDTETKEVTVVGHIGGGLTNPWAASMKEFPLATTQAVLFLADPEAVVDNEASGHKHAPGEECAFCAKNAPSNIDKLAMVQFVDAQGKVLKIGTQKLFDNIKENDMVVIHGQARVTAGGILVINATGLYVRN